MIAYHDGKVLCDIPDSMSVGDTIIYPEVIYQIVSKSIDMSSTPNELYCITQVYDNSESVCDVLQDIYDSNTFKTSGPNTNNIEDNPRLIVLLIIASVIIDDSHLKLNADTYRKNVLISWNNIDIPWIDIFYDNPIAIKSAKKAKPIIAEILERSKIAKNLWPISII